MKNCFPFHVVIAAMLAIPLISVAGSHRGSRSQKAPSVAVWMHNVDYRFTDSVMVHIQDLAGRLVPTSSQVVPVFDDKNSFRIDIDYAQVSVDPEDLTRLLNGYAFAERDSPLKNIAVA